MAEIVKIEAEKCKKDRNYRPEIKSRSKVYKYIRGHKSGGKRSYDPNCDIVWKRKYTRAGELAKIVKLEAERCRKDENYIPEIEIGSRVYFYVLKHRSGGTCSYDPNCDIVWERMHKK